MKIIFGKAGTTIEEYQQYFSHISGQILPKDLKADTFTAQEDLEKFTGSEIIEKAIEHYEGDYEIDGDNKYDKLVNYIQFAVCLMAYREYALNNDATHTKTGRMARMDREQDQFQERLIDRDDMAIQRKIQKAIDRLIDFLDDTGFTEWTGSTIYKETRDLLVWNADLFDRYYPIEKSRRLFLLMVPMIRSAQQDYIAPTLGPTRFANLLSRVQASNVHGDASGSGSGDDESMFALYEKAAYATVYYALANAFKELPVQLFPESMSRQFWNAGNGLAFVTLRDKLIMSLKEEGKRKLSVLDSYITTLDAEEEGETITDEEITTIVERNDSGNKYFRV